MITSMKRLPGWAKIMIFSVIAAIFSLFFISLLFVWFPPTDPIAERACHDTILKTDWVREHCGEIRRVEYLAAGSRTRYFADHAIRMNGCYQYEVFGEQRNIRIASEWTKHADGSYTVMRVYGVE